MSFEPDPVPFVARRPGAPEATAVRTAARRAGSADFGQLHSLVTDPAVTDIFVNGGREVWADRGAGLERQPTMGFIEAELREFAVRLVALGGRHIDESNPCVDTRIHDGIRVHAVLSPISPQGTLLSIRIPHQRPLSLADLESAGFFDDVPAAVVRKLVAAQNRRLFCSSSTAIWLSPIR